MARRLVVWLTATLTCFWLAAAGLGAHVMQEEFGEIFDSALEERPRACCPSWSMISSSAATIRGR